MQPQDYNDQNMGQQGYDPQQAYDPQNPYGQPAYGQQQPYAPKPDSNLGLAIFTTICCCLPLGIVGIIFASKVGDLYNSGRYEEAVQAAKDAKKWSTWGIIGGVVVWILYVIYAVVVGASISNISSFY